MELARVLIKKSINTFFYIPLLVLNTFLSIISPSQSSNKNTTGKSIMNETDAPVEESFLNKILPSFITSAISWIQFFIKICSPSFYINIWTDITVYSLKNLIKLAFWIICFFFSSLVITLMTYYMMNLPNIVENNFNLSFEILNSTSTVQYSEILINCAITRDNCSRIDALDYQVFFEFEYIKNEKSYLQDSFEIELTYQMEYETLTTKKIGYIEKRDYYVEYVYKMIYFPFKILGYFNEDKLSYLMIKDLDNKKLTLKKMEIILKKVDLNIKSSRLLFVPITGYFKSLIWSTRVLTIPSIFIGLILGQLAILFLFGILQKLYGFATS